MDKNNNHPQINESGQGQASPWLSLMVSVGAGGGQRPIPLQLLQVGILQCGVIWDPSFIQIGTFWLTTKEVEVILQRCGVQEWNSRPS